MSCKWCKRVPPEKPTDEDLLVVDSRKENTICGRCLVDAVMTVYECGRTLPSLQKRIRELFVVSNEYELSIRDRIREGLRNQYQAELMAARDPSPTPDEGEKVVVNVKMTKYMKHRIQALAYESELTINSWIRQAIFYAFELTKKKC